MQGRILKYNLLNLIDIAIKSKLGLRCIILFFSLAKYQLVMVLCSQVVQWTVTRLHLCMCL